MCIKFNWSVNSFTISEFSSRQKFGSILGLRNIIYSPSTELLISRPKK